MRRSAVVLLILYAILGVFSAALLNAGVLSMLVIFTFGIGLLFGLAPLAFLYATALLPALFAYGFRLHAAWVIVIAVVPVALLALGPPLLARTLADVQFATLTSGDFHKRGPRTPKTIEFVRRAPFYGGPNTPLRDAVCDATCQKLLLNGEVERVVIAAMQPSGWVGRRVGYTRERLSACPPAFANGEDALPETASAAAHGTCIVPDVEDKAPTALTVTDFVRYPHEDGFAGPPPTGMLTIPRSIRRLDIVDRTEAEPVVIRHATETTMRVLAMPLLLLPGGTGQQLEFAEQWQRDTVVDNPIDVDEILRRGFGFRVAKIEGFDRLDEETLLRLFLDRPGDEPIDDVAQTALAKVMQELARRADLDQPAVALVRDVIADHRIANVMPVGRVLQRHPELTRQFMPDVLARFDWQEAAGTRDTYSPLAVEVMRLTTAELRPYGERLAGFVADGAKWAWVFVPRLGDLSADPVPLLGRALASDSIAYQRHAVTGICRLDPAIAAPLAEPLIGYLDQVKLGRAPPWDFVTGIVALRRFGRDDAVERLLGRLTADQRAQFDRRMKRRQPGDTVDSCRS